MRLPTWQVQNEEPTPPSLLATKKVERSAPALPELWVLSLDRYSPSFLLEEATVVLVCAAPDSRGDVCDMMSGTNGSSLCV